MHKTLTHAALLAAALGAHAAAHASGLDLTLGSSNLSVDGSGVMATFDANGRLNAKGAFFQPLGTNGRTCASCHSLDQAMSITPPQIARLFAKSRGRDPLFAAVDGANCPNGATGDAAAHSLLIQYGLIRVANPLPASAQFTLSVVHDPYGCAITTDPHSGQTMVSAYRRPLPSTNLRFLSAIMWDGRESPPSAKLDSPATFATNLHADLAHQAQSAITNHFQGPTATPAQINDIVAFELGLYSAQAYDYAAGALELGGANGGPWLLATADYYPGINDVLGADPEGSPFDPNGMSLFYAWLNGGGNDAAAESFGPLPGGLERSAARADIAAGEKLFNTLPINISGVRGLNDSLGAPTIPGTCTTCHDAPNIGDHSLPLPLDIGVAHTALPGFESDPAIAKGLAELDQPDLPVFLVSGCPNPFGDGHPLSFYTTDLGKGLISGLCSDLVRTKGPILRGLAGRAPYFHNGAAKTLMQAVNFYDQRFAMNLTEQQKRQLVAFLNAL